MSAISMIEEGIAFAQRRAAFLASDTANAATAGFVPRDIEPALQVSPAGVRFAAAMREIPSGSGIGTLEYAMAATAKNAVWCRALTTQARAILREFKTVAEESRR